MISAPTLPVDSLTNATLFAINDFIESYFTMSITMFGSIIKVGVPPQIGEENKKRTSISEKKSDIM